jgi:hypothetical protein
MHVPNLASPQSVILVDALFVMLYGAHNEMQITFAAETRDSGANTD